VIPPPLPVVPREAIMLALWPAPPKRSDVFYDPEQSLAVRTYKDSCVAQEQLAREGVLMTHKVGNDRINAVWNRMIANKRAAPRLPPLPPVVALPALPVSLPRLPL
jgi:hypothetical protein